MQTRIRYCCSIHGFSLEILAGSELSQRAMDDLLGFFRTERGDAATIDVQSVDTYGSIPIPVGTSGTENRAHLSETEHVLRSGSDYSLYRLDGAEIIDFHGRGAVFIETGAGRARVYMVRPSELAVDVRLELLFFAVDQLLKTARIFSIHASAVEMAGRGVLIVGSSGSGKTTAGLSLMRAGFRSLSDDHPLLRECGGGFEILPFPREVNVTDRSLGFFPELWDQRGRMHRGPEKWSFLAESVFEHGAAALAADPELVLFPVIEDRAESTLEPLSRTAALQALLPHALVTLNREQARREFDFWSRLLGHARSFQLRFGADPQRLPNLVLPELDHGSGRQVQEASRRR